MLLYHVKTKIRNFPFVDKFIHTLAKTNLFPPCYWLLCKLRLDDYSKGKNNPQSRQQSTAYFENNQKRIKQILANLADEKSKKILKQQIQFRCDGRPLPLGTPKDQYFVKNIISLSNAEVFVDCGAFTGDSIRRFLKACKNTYKKIVAIEASPKTFLQLQMNDFANCVYLNMGVWNKKETLCFSSESKETDHLLSSHVSSKKMNTIQIPVEALDQIPSCSDMTFLKMDIEGAELNALKGAEATIRKQLPVLAISIYHSDQDLLDIPCWIMSLGLNYKYYIRHHGFASIDVVFYAVPSATRTVLNTAGM